MPKLSRTLVLFSKDLRTRQTSAEQILWDHLRAERFGTKFKRQVIIGKFIFDFGAKKRKLLIEVDGFAHKAEGRIKDFEKVKYAESKGYKVLKFWNSEVERNLEEVLNKIEAALK